MKLLAILTIPIMLFASSVDVLKSKIVMQIIEGLLPYKKVVIYIDDDSYQNISLSENIEKKSSWCDDANFILTDDVNKLQINCKNKNAVIFATNYKGYKDNTSVAGALFWQKGRPNLIFRKERLDDLSITLPKSFLKYAE